MAQDLTPTVDAIYAALARRDYEGARAFLDPDMTWHSSENFLYAEKNPYEGVERFLEIPRQIAADWETFLIRPDEIMQAGGTAIVRGRYQGKFRGTGFGLDAEFVHVLRFRNGKLISGQSYTDTAQFRDAVRHLQRPVTHAPADDTETIAPGSTLP